MLPQFPASNGSTKNLIFQAVSNYVAQVSFMNLVLWMSSLVSVGGNLGGCLGGNLGGFLGGVLADLPRPLHIDIQFGLQISTYILGACLSCACTNLDLRVIVM